jgi:choice-of-anchor B domain-containing protein
MSTQRSHVPPSQKVCAAALYGLLALALLGAPAIADHSPCIDGQAEGFFCQGVDLLGHYTPAELGAGGGNDSWGWTDPLDGREIAIMGLNNGTAFVDLEDPEHSVYLGRLDSHTGSSTWRDIKVYADHAYIVSEAGGHGLQIFDLTQLRSVPSPPATFTETAHYDGFGSAHNLVINEESGFAYAVGTGTCSGGLHMLDLSDPVQPVFVGCFSDDGYTHDAQCVNYIGPDPDHQGKEICVGSNEDTITLVDVTDKSQPVQISRTSYTGVGYTHQAWLTEDHVHLLVDDETDEINRGHGTRTYIWDLSDLDAPQVIGTHTATTNATDHNQYVLGNYLYQANYRAGLRILRIDDIADGLLEEVAYFDVVPSSDNPGFEGAWSVYPYFESGTVIVSTDDEGLFILRPQLCENPEPPTGLTVIPGGDGVLDLAWSATAPVGGGYRVYRSPGTCPGSLPLQVAAPTGPSFADTVSGQVDYAYTVTAVDESGFCESPPSGCASGSTTGACTAPPAFAGVETASNLGQETCGVELTWSVAEAPCGGGVVYSVYRSTDDPDFEPAEANRVASGLTGTGWVDYDVESGVEHTYIVRATDLGNDGEDPNTVRVSATATGPAADGSWATGAETGDRSLLFETVTSANTPGPKPSEKVLHIGWEPTSARARSGARSYFSTYANDQCSAAMTPPIQLTAGESPELTFYSVFEIEDDYDGGVIQISTDGGSSWSLLTPAEGYPDTIAFTGNECGLALGTGVFSGTDLTWDPYTVDLSAWAGQEVRLRWLFSTDGGLTQEGWYVDDLAITHAQVAGSCSGGLIFLDDFETGDRSRWSLSVP